MSAMGPEVLVGYEWEVDRRCIVARCHVWLNVVDYLWRVSLGSSAGFIRVVPFRHARPPLSGSTMPDPGLGATRFD